MMDYKRTREQPLPAELTRYAGQPLPPQELARIWFQLPEEQRLPFVLSLDEAIADAVIEETWRMATAQA